MTLTIQLRLSTGKRIVYLALLLAALFYSVAHIRLSGHVLDYDLPVYLHSRHEPKSDNLADVHNQTLGFEEVYLISLPERLDRRDAFALQAALSGISYKIVDGVDGSKVPSKALPYTMDINVGAIGCWRAHLNIYQSMVHHNVASALVFEDDADWDVSLKMQMVQFARGARFLLNTPEDQIPYSPYGDGWDILWVGHCSTESHPGDNRRFVIPNDPTVLPPHARVEFEKPDMTPFESGPGGNTSTRIVHIPMWGSCSPAWAISLQGAKKILYHESTLPFNDPVDNGVGYMCLHKKSNFTCVAPFPTLIGISKPAGNRSRWSDIIEDISHDKSIEEMPLSERLMFPTRQNIDRLLRGETVFKSQFPEVTGEEMNIEEIGRAVGHPGRVGEVHYADWLMRRLQN